MHQRTVRGQCSRCQQEANSSIGMRISQRAINTPGSVSYNLEEHTSF